MKPRTLPYGDKHICGANIERIRKETGLKQLEVVAQLQVLGIDIISHTETPSLGAVAADTGSAGQRFRARFVGLSGELTVADSDAITAATITSRAVTEGANAALACAANLSKEAA